MDIWLIILFVALSFGVGFLAGRAYGINKASKALMSLYATIANAITDLIDKEDEK